MAMKVTYTVMNGRILSENRAGVKRDYVADSLGSTVALLDNTQTKTDTFTYWPYGEVRSRTGTTATPFQYVGTLGYYRDSSGRTYVRARTLRTDLGRWQTWNDHGLLTETENGFTYAVSNPITMLDTDGMRAQVGGPGQQKPKPPDLIDYGFYCGPYRHPYRDKWPDVPPKDKPGKPRPVKPFDPIDGCCADHDRIYWCHDCKSALQSGQSDLCHHSDLVLCKCVEGKDCNKLYPPGRDRDNCINFKGNLKAYCELVVKRYGVPGATPRGPV